MRNEMDTSSSSPSRLLVALIVDLGAAAAAGPVQAQDVLEEIIVTATRVETNLQQTPMSIQTFTGEDLELGGIDNGRDLGIMVPNVVLNPSGSELRPTMIIRGLPGVTTYFDGFWAGTWGFLQRSFVELDRVEVLRGPQGTLFGRNTNGGAIQMISRRPADEFGVRFGMELGEFDHRSVNVAADVPVSERLLTKWTAAIDRNDGFLESQSAPFALGSYENSLFRGDVLWQPSDAFSLRFTANVENRRSSDSRIVRITNPFNREYIAYNVLAGNPDYLNEARAVDPDFPDPPFALPGNRFTAESHEPGYPGGTLGKWQTRSDTAGPTAATDNRFITLTLDWEIGDHWSLESLTSYNEGESWEIVDYDASEFTFTTAAFSNDWVSASQELHLIGDHLGGRLQTLLGVWHNRWDAWDRNYQWAFSEFTIPSTGPDVPEPNMPAILYVQSWGATVGNPAVANFFPFITVNRDTLSHAHGSENAIFGELKIGVLERLDLTIGFRFTSDEDGEGYGYTPADAFRPIEPGTIPAGDTRAVSAVLGGGEFASFGTVSSPRYSLAYRPADNVYLYASYSEGFTQGEVVNNPNVPAPIFLDPEVVETKEIGIRSDWRSGRLRFNATYFDAKWDGLRVAKRIPDPNSPDGLSPFGVPTSDGVAASNGFEFDISYLPGERWELDLALGLLDTEYLDIGDPPANGSGLQPGIPFQYAPALSYSLGVRYRLPLASGEMVFAGDYGWMDEYQRDSANEFQNKNPDGSPKFEPSYGILNARLIYEPADADWQVSLYGTNLTDEWYVNGGLDVGLFWGYDFATIGRPRELGVGVQFTVD